MLVLGIVGGVVALVVILVVAGCMRTASYASRMEEKWNA